AVRGGVAAADEPGDGGDGHDPAISALDHAAQDGPRAEERAGRVDVEVRAPVVQCRAGERGSGRHACIVDEHVDAAEPVEERLDRGLVGNVELVVPGRVHLVFGEPLADGLADPLGAPGDDDDATHAASAFRSSLPDGVFGSSSTNTTSRGYLCGESRSRTKPCSSCSSIGCRTTTYARGIVSPSCATPTTAHPTTSGRPTSPRPSSAGAAQIP